jgi:hypothetical protein
MEFIEFSEVNPVNDFRIMVKEHGILIIFNKGEGFPVDFIKNINDFVRSFNVRKSDTALIISSINDFYCYGTTTSCIALAFNENHANAWEKEIDKMLESNAYGRDPYHKWRVGTDTGISSKFMYSVLLQTGESIQNYPPGDGYDFGRCHRLIKRFPELRDKLHLVSEANPQWGPIISNWEALEKMAIESGLDTKNYENFNHEKINELSDKLDQLRESEMKK